MFGTFVNDELVSICGFIIFKYFPQADDLSCKVGYITSVYTKEDYRKNGYQRKAFEKCIEFTTCHRFYTFELKATFGTKKQEIDRNSVKVEFNLGCGNIRKNNFRI